MFPNITHYQPLLDLIKDKPMFVSRIDEENGLITIGYKILVSGAFDGNNEYESSLLRECRGITFDLETGKVLSRRFHKFGNLNDSEENQIDNIDFTKRHWLMDKLDGSMVSFIYKNGNYHCLTKMGVTPFASLAKPFIKNENYRLLIDDTIAKEQTAIFEFTSPEATIVIPYSQTKLTLLAIRDNTTGYYVYNPSELKEYGKKFGVPVVDSFESNENIVNDIDELRTHENIEGYIIRFENGDMKKCKTNFYLERHRYCTGSTMTHRKDIVKAILEDNIDDILPMIDNVKSRQAMIDFRDNFIVELDENVNYLKSLYNNLLLKENELPSKKDFYIAVKSLNIPMQSQSILLSNYGKPENIEEAVKKIILQKTSRGPYLDEVSYLFNDLEYKPLNNFVLIENQLGM